MSAHMKMRHIDIEVNNGNELIRFSHVPFSTLSPVWDKLKTYEEEKSIPWREAFASIIGHNEIGILLKERRVMSKMTQTKLANLLHMPQANISQIESGRRKIGKKLAKKLAEIFNVNYRVFL